MMKCRVMEGRIPRPSGMLWIWRCLALLAALQVIGLTPGAGMLYGQDRIRLVRLRPTGPQGREGLLVNPRNIALDDRDYTYLSDLDPSRIVVFDSVGKYVRTVGRAGQGPGEFNTPVIAVAGRQLLVYDSQLRRVTMFDTAGKLQWTRSGPCCLAAPPHIDKKGRLFVTAGPLVIGGGPPWQDLIVYSPRGDAVDTLKVPTRNSDRSSFWAQVDPRLAISVPIPFKPASYFTVTRTGTVLRGRSSEYVIVESRKGEDTVRLVQRNWRVTELSHDAREEAVEALVAEYRRFLSEPDLRRLFPLDAVPINAPAFFGLDTDACGRWWVLRSSGYMGTPTMFDVFDSKGAYLGSPSIPEAVFEPARWAVGLGRLALISEDTSGAPDLALFRVEPYKIGCDLD
jgi:hypothetical protein